MKKLGLLVMPLIAVSFLANCGQNKPTYDAKLIVNTGETVTLSNNIVSAFEDYETILSFSDELYHNKKMPTNLTKVTSKGQTVDYTYVVDSFNLNKATLKIDKSFLKGDVEITLSLNDKTKWYEYNDWWNYCSNGKDKEQATKDDIGKEVGLMVNGLNHKVRLIDVDHKEPEEKVAQAHCTFEFANVITDSNGKAVTTYWNNKSGTESANNNFPNSTLNDLLNNTKLDNCIFKALPIGLQAAIKETNKKVGTREDVGEDWEATNYLTKLFPLAYDEMADHESAVTEGEGTKYQYYKDHKEEKDRIKRKVGSDTEDVGELYWTRSPLTSGSAAAWDVDDEGPIYSTNVFKKNVRYCACFLHLIIINYLRKL